MTPDTPKSPEPVEALIAGLFDGDLSDEAFEQLSQILHEDENARALYLEAAQLEVNLDRAFALPHAHKHAPQAIHTFLKKQQLRWTLGIAAAAAILIAVTMAFIQTQSPASQVDLRFADHTHWSINGKAASATPSLKPGDTFTLHRGAAELSLPHDVRAVVEAPAHLVVIDDQTLQLDRGQAFFQIDSPAGKGFTVITPHQKIIDLGTAFGLRTTTEPNDALLEVIDGSVRIEALDGSKRQIIQAPRAVHLDGPAITSDIAVADATFMRELPASSEIIFSDDFESGFAPHSTYAVTIGPNAIHDLAGNRFAGLDDPTTWSFHTGSSYPREIPIRNPSFEEDGSIRQKLQPVAHWQVKDDTWGFAVKNREEDNGVTAAHGKFFGRLIKDLTIFQLTNEPITAGTTYELTLEVGLDDSAATIAFFGSDAGPDHPLATTTIQSHETGWLKRQSLTYTATAADASGQSLGITLTSQNNFAAFDDLRLGASGHTDSGTLPASERDAILAATPPAARPDTTPPTLVRLHPTPGSTDAPAAGALTLVFNESVQPNTGRLVIRNLTLNQEWILSPHNDRVSFNGPIVTIYPPTSLTDGTRRMGRLGGWQSNAWVGTFNPAGDGSHYQHFDLLDSNRHSRGALELMHGPTVATFEMTQPNHFVQRQIGTLNDHTRYAITAAIGVRDRHTSDAAPFSGYSIQLVSGSTILAETSGDSPPGPPNQFTTVGFSWDAASRPATLPLGAPLSLKITPHQTSANHPGYLDFDHVHVTATPTQAATD